MAILIIFPVSFQTVINLIMLPIGEQRARYQIILVGEKRHVCKPLAQSRYLAVHWAGIEPGISGSPVHHATVTPPSHTLYTGHKRNIPAACRRLRCWFHTCQQWQVVEVHGMVTHRQLVAADSSWVDHVLVDSTLLSIAYRQPQSHQWDLADNTQ